MYFLLRQRLHERDFICNYTVFNAVTPYVYTTRRRLHERHFICKRIVFEAVTASVYTTPIETVAETTSI